MNKLIGKSDGKTGISTLDKTSVTIRGKDLCEDLIGSMNITAYFYFLLLGKEPKEEQIFFLDAVLVAIAEHGLTPSVQASRMTYAAGPEALQGAVAAGILGCGSVILGSSQDAGEFLSKGVNEAAELGGAIKDVAMKMVEQYKADGRRLPGLGHPDHWPVDPRTERLIDLAKSRGIAGKHTEFLIETGIAADRLYNRHFVINISAAIPAIMLDLDFPLVAIKGIPILARTIGLIAHAYEESQRPIGFLMSSHGDTKIEYDGG